MPFDDLTTVVIPTRRRKIIYLLLYTIGIVLVTSAITIPTAIHLAGKTKSTITTAINSTTPVPTETSTTLTTTIIETSTTSLSTTTTTPPLEESLCYIGNSNIPIWEQDGTTVAGGNEEDNQLFRPWGIYVDDNQTVYIADTGNGGTCIIEWKNSETIGHIIYARSSEENSQIELGSLSDMIYNPEHDNFSYVITLIPGLALDDDGYLYVPSYNEHKVTRWKVGVTDGIIVAGGNECGDDLNQICYPQAIYVDHDYSLYVVENRHFRIMKWVQGADAGIVIAPSQQYQNTPAYQTRILGIIVDDQGALYVIDHTNGRIVRWIEGDTQPCIVVGGNGTGQQANQLDFPKDIVFDRQGNLYVTDSNNYRIQKFNRN